MPPLQASASPPTRRPYHWRHYYAALRLKFATSSLQRLVSEAKYNPNQPRVPAGNPDGGQWTDGAGASSRPLGDLYAQRRANRRHPNYPNATPAQLMRLSVAHGRADAEIARVRQLAPGWRPTPSAYSGIEGEIERFEAEAREARARYDKLTAGVPEGYNPIWGHERLRQELYDRGFRFRGPTKDSPGTFYENSATKEELRIMDRPNRRSRKDPDQKYYFKYYYRYRKRDDQPWGDAVGIPDKPEMKMGEMKMHLVDVYEMKQRILAELEEAGVENIFCLLNTCLEPEGQAWEAAVFRKAVAELVEKDLATLCVKRRDPPLQEWYDKKDSMALAERLTAYLVFKDNCWTYPIDWENALIVEVVATRVGAEVAERLLDERGYQWWRPRRPSWRRKQREG